MSFPDIDPPPDLGALGMNGPLAPRAPTSRRYPISQGHLLSNKPGGYKQIAKKTYKYRIRQTSILYSSPGLNRATLSRNVYYLSIGATTRSRAAGQSTPILTPCSSNRTSLSLPLLLSSSSLYHPYPTPKDLRSALRFRSKQRVSSHKVNKMANGYVDPFSIAGGGNRALDISSISP